MTAVLTDTLYLPIIQKPAIDLAISWLEVTQASQTASNSVPMVENRAAVARVYAYVAQGQNSVNGITITLSAARDEADLGLMSIVSATIPNNINRSDFNNSANFQLPANWLTGTVTLTATIETASALAEPSLANNIVSQTLTFNSVPALDLKLVPINYTHLPTGAYFPGPATDNESGWLMRGYPLSAVNVSFRAPLEFQGDLSQASEWNRLLSVMASLKNGDGSPAGQVYYGVIPTSNSNGDTYPRAWGGYAAIGWVRAGVGVEKASQLAAHEIGHMFGRSHVDCGNPAGPDPNYPYFNGSIGQYGLDVSFSQVYSPFTAKDLMSYCYPQWVSDYTYTALYNDQRSKGLLAREIAPGLLIRVNFDEPAQPLIEPVYALTTGLTPLPENSEFAVELMGADGRLLATYPLALFNAAEPGLSMRAANVVLPMSSEPVAEIRLAANGRLLATRSLQLQEKADFTIASNEWGRPELVWSETAVPALIRIQSPGSDAWTTLGIDIIGGKLPLAARYLESGGQIEVILANTITSE